MVSEVTILAELSFILNDSNAVENLGYIYCVCSRVLCRNSLAYINYEHNGCNDTNDESGSFNEIEVENENDIDTDRISAIFSPDECESQELCNTGSKTQMEIQSSDSGADLSEYYCNDQISDMGKHKSNLYETRKYDESAEYLESRKYLECQTWDKYWTLNGERLIWASWIEKYSEYIDPEFSKQNINTNLLDPNDSINRNSSSPNNTTNLTLITTLGNSSNSGIPSNSDNYLDINSCVDPSAQPRCASSNSVPMSNIDTDSMTNVTQLTLSSFEWNSSIVTSESSKNSADAIMFEPEISSSWPDNSSSSSTQDCDNAMDSDQYWQLLWKKHVEELYAKHYALYITEHMLFNENKNDDAIIAPAPAHENLFSKVKNKRLREKNKSNKYVMSVGALLKNLNSANIDEWKINCNSKQDNTETVMKQFNNSHISENAVKNQEAHHNLNIDVKNKDTTNLDKQDHDALKNAKAAFSLMGFGFSGNNTYQEQFLQDAEVLYRKKNIRLQNKYLKFKLHRNETALLREEPLHVYFDDEGNPSKSLNNLNVDKESSELNSSDEECLKKINKTSPTAQKLTNNILDLNMSCSSCNTEFEQHFNDSCQLNATNVSEEKCTRCLLDANGKTKRERKKRKKPKKILKLLSESECNQNLIKYWYKRYSLFSKFDEGILMDAESWYSVSPEKVAQHTAQRCRCDLIIDAFCGAGGNAIQFAMICERVIAIDIDPEKIRIAQHNAAVYGVADRIEFIVGDFLLLSDSLVADVVFLSPPWGGPQYLKDDYYDVEKSLLPVSGSRLLAVTRNITENIALFLPRNTDANQLVLMAGPGSSVEIEQNFLDKKLIAVTAYYGELVAYD